MGFEPTTPCLQTPCRLSTHVRRRPEPPENIGDPSGEVQPRPGQRNLLAVRLAVGFQMRISYQTLRSQPCADHDLLPELRSDDQWRDLT